MIENEDSKIQDLPGTDQPVIIHIPVKGSPSSSVDDENLNNNTLTYSDSGHPSEDSGEVAKRIANDVGVEHDDSLTEAVRCAAYWRSLGADTLIYISSYGTTMVANGLIIRFFGVNIIISSFLANLAAVIGFQNATIFFKSLLHPPQDEVPEEQKKCFEMATKYGLLPVSWTIRAALSGTTVALLRDTSFATQQTVSAITSGLVGPIMYGMRSSIRSCLRGTIKLTPKDDGVKAAFALAYGNELNPKDEDRPYLWGTARDTFIRIIAMSSSTIVMALTNGFNIQSYCLGGQEELKNLTNSNQSISFEDIEKNCLGGPFTFLLRDLGIAFTYGIAMLIFEPLLNGALNKIFNYFYGTSKDTSSSVEVEDVTDQDSKENA